jgi:hypothetical protein
MSVGAWILFGTLFAVTLSGAVLPCAPPAFHRRGRRVAKIAEAVPLRLLPRRSCTARSAAAAAAVLLSVTVSASAALPRSPR